MFSSPSFPHPVAYEQFLPLLLFISFERNFRLRLIPVWTDFERGAIHSSLLSTHRRKGPDSQQLGSDVCWGLFASKRRSIMCRTALGTRSGTRVSSVTHCNISLLFTCSLSGPVSPGSLSIHRASTDGFESFCKRDGAQSYPSPLFDDYVVLGNKAWSWLN